MLTSRDLAELTKERNDFYKAREAKAADGGRPYKVVSNYKTVVVLAHNKNEAARVAMLPCIKSITRI